MSEPTRKKLSCLISLSSRRHVKGLARTELQGKTTWFWQVCGRRESGRSLHPDELVGRAQGCHAGTTEYAIQKLHN